jgi:hypothetical protein
VCSCLLTFLERISIEGSYKLDRETLKTPVNRAKIGCEGSLR